MPKGIPKQFHVGDNIVLGKQNALKNIRRNTKRELPWIDRELPPHDTPICIVGGGPTLKETLPELKKLSKTCVVAATNKTPEFLKENGVRCDYHLFADPQDCRQFIDRAVPKTYFVSSQCDPRLFEALKDEDVILFHIICNAWEKDIIKIVEQAGRPAKLLAGGETGVHRLLEVAYHLGFRKYHLFGFDASGSGHAYEHVDRQKDHDDIHIEVCGKPFYVKPQHYRQAGQYEFQHKTLVDRGCEITAHGDSLIPHIARELNELRSSG